MRRPRRSPRPAHDALGQQTGARDADAPAPTAA
jgi:hypothetical protein